MGRIQKMERDLYEPLLTTMAQVLPSLSQITVLCCESFQRSMLSLVSRVSADLRLCSQESLGSCKAWVRGRRSHPDAIAEGEDISTSPAQRERERNKKREREGKKREKPKQKESERKRYREREEEREREIQRERERECQ